MKETRFISFNLGSKRLPETKTILARCDLADIAEVSELLGAYCSVELDVTDPRLALLLGELRKVGENPRPRADRTYTARELSAFEWLLLRVRTNGLFGGYNCDQPYEQGNACALCGAGATPIPPIVAELTRMGKKKLDCTAHDGLVIVTRELAEVIECAELTGVEFHAAQDRTRSELRGDYRWMKIVSEWEPVSSNSVLAVDDLCPECGRAGHYDSWERVTELHYEAAPHHAPDFNHTWEYFERWRMNESDQRPHVGGHRWIVVSQRAREVLRSNKVRHIGFEPVLVASGERGSSEPK